MDAEPTVTLAEADPGDETDPPQPETPAHEQDADDTATLCADLHQWIVSSLDLAEAISERDSTREINLAVTKLEEAEMWLLKLLPFGEEVN